MIEYGIDIHAAESLANPYPVYEAIAAAPRVKTALGWFVTSYADVGFVLQSPAFSARRPELDLSLIPEHVREAEAQLRDHSNRWFLRMDGGDHVRLRRLVKDGFGAESLRAMEPRIDAIVRRLLDRAKDEATVDIIAGVAYSLPTLVTADFIGFPAEDLDTVLAWTANIEAAYDKGPDWASHVQRQPPDVTGLLALCDYLERLVAERRARPTGDFVSSLLQAEESGDRMSVDEIVATCVMLIRTGRETVTNLIGNGLLALLNNPEQLRLLRGDPTLLAGAVREFLRFEPPIQLAARTATEPVDVSGRHIAAGDVVNAVIGAANRDPAVFERPAELDLRRRGRAHMAFGRGPHVCVAAQLAAMQAASVFSELLWNLPEFELTGEPLRWGRNPSLRGLRALPIRFL